MCGSVLIRFPPSCTNHDSRACCSSKISPVALSVDLLPPHAKEASPHAPTYPPPPIPILKPQYRTTSLPTHASPDVCATHRWLRISVGRYELSAQPVDNNNGVCEWYQPLQLKSNFALPMDPEQVPDLIVHLMAVSDSAFVAVVQLTHDVGHDVGK